MRGIKPVSSGLRHHGLIGSIEAHDQIFHDLRADRERRCPDIAESKVFVESSGSRVFAPNLEKYSFCHREFGVPKGSSHQLSTYAVSVQRGFDIEAMKAHVTWLYVHFRYAYVPNLCVADEFAVHISDKDHVLFERSLKISL